MSADYGRDTGTCQACGQPRRAQRTGVIRAHRRDSGTWCLGGGSLSAEAHAAGRANTHTNGDNP